MVLVDTSVWIEHFRDGRPELAELLNNAQIACHPLVVGELACGSLKNRAQILSLLQALPIAVVAEHTEVLRLVESQNLMNRGLGYIDVQLVASALLTNIPIWTMDKRLRKVAVELTVNYEK